MSTKFNPKIRSSIVSVGEVFDAIKDPEGFVRPTTRIENLQRALDRGTDSTVMRSMGYKNLFETFEKKGINKVTINKFKNIPDITDYLDKDGKLNNTKLNKYNKDLKKFRLDAFKGLSPKDIKTIESSGFLSQFAKDQRNQILKSGGKFNQKNLNKVLDQMFDFTFKDLDTAAGVKNPQIQDTKITKAMDKVDANKNIKPDQKLNIKFGLSQVDKLVKMGNTPAARKLLTAILTLAPKGLFGMDLLIPTTMGSGELPEEGTPEYEQLMQDMGKNQGGMMDINFMTRPMGYKDGTRDGTLVGDKKEEIPVREIVRDEPEGIMGTLKSILSKKEFGTIENPLPLDRVFDPGVSQKTLIDEGAFITTPDGITFKATPFMFDKYLGTKYVENNTFGQRDDVEVEFRPKYITSAEKSFVEPGGMFDQIQTPRKEGRFTEMNQGGIMDINQLTKRIR
jgi:hypothetical protein